MITANASALAPAATSGGYRRVDAAAKRKCRFDAAAKREMAKDRFHSPPGGGSVPAA